MKEKTYFYFENGTESGNGSEEKPFKNYQELMNSLAKNMKQDTHYRFINVDRFFGRNKPDYITDKHGRYVRCQLEEKEQE